MRVGATAVVVLGALAAPLSVHAQSPVPPPASSTRPPPAPARSDEITVTGERQAVTTSIESRAYLLDRDLNAATGTLADALRNVPSVSVDTEGNVSLRGDQSVQIYVDGKPSPLFAGAARAQAILNFAAKDIERVEVMTTPSAAYSPEGSGGIINLIMKNAVRASTTSTLSAQYGNSGSTRFSGSYSRKAGKWTVTASLNRNNDAYASSSITERSAISSPGAASLDSINRFWQSFENTSTLGNFSAAYDATPKLQFTASASGSTTDSTLSLPAQGNYRAFSAGVPVSAYQATTVGNHRILTSGYGAGFTRKFDGQEHDLAVTYNFARNGRFMLFDTAYAQSVPSPSVRFDEAFTNLITRQDFVRVNYRRPMPKEGKLRLGYELQHNDNDYGTYYARGPTTATLVSDPNVASQFEFQQNVNSIFGTYERPWGPLSAQVGLRVEAVEMTIAKMIQRDYTHAYPSLNFGYKLDDANSLRGGYSLRVQRPPPQSLNPFRTQGGELGANEGNPDLRPQETDSYELGYQYRKAQTSYLATLYYRVTSDEFTFVARDLGGGLTVYRPENLGSSRNAGIELVTNGRLTSTLKYSLNATPYWREIDAGNLGFAGKRSAFGIGGNASLNWDPSAKDGLQLNLTATGKRLNPQGYLLPYWALNLGWRHKFNDRVSTSFTVRDAFETQNFKEVVTTTTLRSLSRARQNTSRAAFFQLSYAFGASRPTEPAFDYGGGN